MSDITISVIDDNYAVCHAIKFLLNSFFNLNIKIYLHPRLFLNEFSAHSNGCVIIDLDLPSINGIDLTKQIKKISPATQVIIISGHGFAELKDQSIAAGARAFIMKPFKIEQLIEQITNILAIISV